MELIEFLNLDISDENNVQEVMYYVSDYLEELNQSDFSGKTVHRLSGIIGKFIQLAKYYMADYDTIILYEDTQKLIRSIIDNENGINANRRAKSIRLFESISSTVIEIYNEIRNNLNLNRYNEFELLYNPHKSKKEEAITLIYEVIKILSDDDSLPIRLRNKIIDQLHKIIANLKRDKPNWSIYFGDLHQTIIILGAIGSLIGGIASVASLKSASEKLIQATQIIDSTSINTNFNFNFNIGNNIYSDWQKLPKF
jgi:hypothetical protein